MKTKFVFKRVLTLVLAVMMLVTAMPVGLLAESGAAGTQNDGKFEIKYDDGTIIHKEDYLNKTDPLKINPVKTGDAGNLIKNPAMPKLYTVRSDFKVERGDDLVVSFQPYIATAGDYDYEYTDENGVKKKVLSYTEKSKIDKKVTFPQLDGYASATPKREANINYDFIKKRAMKNYNSTDKVVEYKGQYDYIYTPRTSTVKIKHLFQDIKDFNKYGKKPGETEDIITEQHGLTGTSLTIQALPSQNIKGYVPEGTNIKTQVPENPANFEVELRYNLAHYTINYDTAGGTPLPTRTVFYMQGIPKLNNEDIPTKEGGIFQGWKPSVDLNTSDGKTFKANEVIKDSSGNAIKNLDLDIKMPAGDLTFTAVWKNKPKADYAIQFWAEKADHDENASLLEKYDFMGTKVFKDENTGTRPYLDNVSIDKIPFPDLDQARLEKIWRGEKFNRDKHLFLNKFFVYNGQLTHDQNKDDKQPTLIKSVSSTGRTVYNIYYDRQVYELYFTQSNWFENQDYEGKKGAETFYPSIYEPDGKSGAKLVGEPGNPYHFKARFNEHMKKWPNDSMQTKGFTPGMQSYGWGPNYSVPAWPTHLDTPPYRLNADEFLDMDYTGGGNDGVSYERNGGYTKNIDAGNGKRIYVDNDDFTTLSFGIKQGKNSIPHHMDLWMDGFKDGETIIRYDLYRSKADTDSDTYGHKYPKVQGFTAKRASKRTTLLTENDIDEKNDERDEITPFPTKEYKDIFGFKHTVGQIAFIRAFFNNADGFGDPLDGISFEKNGYLKFEYTRKKYPLRFNYDPTKTKGDNEFDDTNQIQTFYNFPLKVLSPDLVPDKTAREDKEYFKDNPANFLDNPENLKKLGLTDLIFNDPNDNNKLKVKRPDNIKDQKEFKGWALDPAGNKLIWENSSERMPSHAVNLYAKWDDPDYKWKVTFDPDGGVLEDIDEKDVTKERKTIQEGDIGQEEQNTYPKKEKDEGDKQVFTVIQKQKLVEPKLKPTKKGYDFMGWEFVRYEKDTKGNDTTKVDESYYNKYKVPELYSFGNDVVSNVHLKAIWVESDLLDINSYHHFLDKDFKEYKRDTQVLRGRRVGSYLAAVGSRQNAERLLVPQTEWDELKAKNKEVLPGPGSMTYEEYTQLSKDPVKNPRVNSYNQQIKIEPEKIKAKSNPPKLIDNPDAKLNQFHFYYRPFRHREYKVNYLDERGRKEVEAFINASKKEYQGIKNHQTLSDEQRAKAYKDLLENKSKAFEAIRKKYAIIDQELVKNGKRHFDARNYRPIAGWVLNDKPQQQLFFDIDEKTNAFHGINETGLDEINFFYKDVRVMEVPENGNTPEGYVRVTFKADEGGAFKNKDGNEVKELHYDVVKGFRSNYLPVPKVLGAGETMEEGRYYITPDSGKNFAKWDNEKLLNDNTILEKDYSFTAYFDWTDLNVSSTGLVRTESYIDPNGKWTNKFAPTIEELKKQLVLTKNNTRIDNIDEYIVAEFYDEKGKELETDEDVLDLLKEQGKKDTEELVRRVNIKAKVKFKDQKYKELEKEEEGLGDEIAKLKAQIAENNKKITELNKEIVDKEAEKAKLDSAVPEDQAKIAALEQDIAAMKTEINNLETQNTDNKAAIITNKEEIDTKTAEISKLKGELSTLKTELETKQAAIASKEAELKPLEKQSRELNEKISVDSEELNKLKAEGKLTAAEIKDKQDKIDELKKNATDIENKINRIKADLSTLKTEEAAKQAEITKKEADINKLEKEIWNKAQAIKDYEAGIKEQELDIAVTIYKNVYEALTNGDMPKVLKDATAPGGDLDGITDKYVKVTVQPTNKPSNKDAKIYYVNPKAWVKIEEVDISKDASNLGFKKWTADKANQNEDGTLSGEFDFTKRHKFTKDTEITPILSEDVIEQTDPDKPDVPDDFVKVVVSTKEAGVEKASDVTKFERTFWVNPTKEVTIDVTNPTGKTEAAAAGVQAKAWIFEEWTSDESPARTWPNTIKAQFTEAVTNITAKYKQADNIITYDPEEPITKPKGYVRVKFAADEGLTLSNVQYYYVKQNSGVKLYDLTYPTVGKKTGYEHTGWDQADTTEIGSKDITVTAEAEKLDSFIPDDGKNTKPEGYVEVEYVIKTEDQSKGSLDGVTKFFVKPNEYVPLNPPVPKPNTGYDFGAWNKDTKIPTIYKKDTKIIGSFNDLDDVSLEDKPGYVKVEFTIEGEGGSILTGQNKVFYVNPNKDVTIDPPKTSAETGYVFEKWDPDTVTTPKKYTTDTTVKGSFTNLDDIIPSNNGDNAKPEGYVTVTFKKGAHGSAISGETTFYVNPDANKTIGVISPKPTVIPDIGYAQNGWDKDDNFKIREDTIVNAKYDDFDTVIPEKDASGNSNLIPLGYIKITFDTTADGTITGSTETKKVVYVKPNTPVVLKGYEPQVEAKAGSTHTGWDADLTLATVYNGPKTITALYNVGDSISKTEKTGYIKVEFKSEASMGTLQGDTELWVKPNTQVTLPTPFVSPKTGYEFDKWDKKLTVTLPADLPQGKTTYVINAEYTGTEDIIPAVDGSGKANTKPEGYVTVTFRADDNGKLEDDKKEIVYFVNPNARIKLVEGQTAKAKELAVPKTIPDTNYKFDKWYESLDLNNTIKTDLEYVARFNKGKVTLTYEANGATGTPPIPVIVDHGTKVRLASATGLSKADASFKGWSINGSNDLKQDGDEITLTKDTKAVAQWTTDEDIIEYDPKEPTTRPDKSYVRVTFEAETGLSLTEQKAYYVKANKGITLGNPMIAKPGKTAETGYEFEKWDPADSTEITKDITVKAKATKLKTVIPEKDNNNQANKKPGGYKEVTFVIKDEDKDKGSITGVAKFYVNPTEYVKITPPATKANTGFVFGGWDNDTTIPTVYDKDTTIKGSFNGLNDLIKKVDNQTKKPDGYVTVTFVIDPDTGGQIVDGETTVYYVKPNAKVTITPPQTIAKTGYEFKGWDTGTTDVSFTTNTTIKGSFKKLEDIIPAEENGTTNAKPDGYIKVTFDKGEHGKKITGQTVYYVNPEADPLKTLGDSLIAKPTVTPETGYKFTGWDKEDATEIKDSKDIVVKAQYTELPDAILKKEIDDREKPDGYIKVTFDTTDKGRIKGTSRLTKKVYFVNPNKPVVLKDKAPDVVPKTGLTHAGWDVSIDQAIQYKDNTFITALYNDPGDISTTEVFGYVKVIFDNGGNGELEGTTEYWIRPGVDVNIPAPTVKPNIGYKFDTWSRSLSINAQLSDSPIKITAEYEKLDDIIPEKNIEGLDRPDGYVTVTFKGVHGTLEEPTIYYVKPGTEINLLDDIFSDGLIKEDNADLGYTAKGGEWSNEGTEIIRTITINKDETITYTFKKLDDVIEKINDTQEPPKGYVKVTLDPSDKATDETKAERVYFVNPTVTVKLPEFEPTGKEITDAHGNKYTYEFNFWTSTRGVLGTWYKGSNIQTRFTQDTDITAKYKINAEKLINSPRAKENVITPLGVKPEAKDLIKNVYDPEDPNNKDNLPKETKFEYEQEPDVSKAGNITAKVKVTYPGGKTVIVDVPIKVVDNVIPQEGEEKPNNVPKDFVKVTFVPTDKGTMEGAKIFWVKPNVDVKIPVKDPVGKEYNIFKEWKLGVKADGKVFKANEETKFEEATTITATYIDSDKIIPFDPNPTGKDPMARPDGYVKVTFDADLGLKLTDSKAYYVKKNAGITLKQLTKPEYKVASGYKFDKWDKDDSTIILDKDIVVTAKATQVSSPSKPGDRPGRPYPEIIYRDRIVEKEKIVEKIVKVGENDELLKEIRYMQGYNGKFRPYDGLTRAEAAQILANALKADGYRYDANYALSYSDVGSKWYTDAVRVVTQAGVFQGYSDGTFRPQGKITRAEWVATLRRFQDLKEASGNTMMLRSNHWATAEVEAAYEAGWLGVYQNGIAKFDADKPITRQEVAYVSNKAFDRVLDKAYLKRNVNNMIHYKDINPSMPLYEDILCASNTLLTDNRYYKANTVVMDNLTFNIVTDYLRIQQKKFQYNVIR